MSKAEERALEAYPYSKGRTVVTGFGTIEFDQNHDERVGFVEGYKQAEQDTIERACQLLYDWNNQMTTIFGAKAVLSCSQFTIDVDRFRKILKME